MLVFGASVFLSLSTARVLTLWPRVRWCGHVHEVRAGMAWRPCLMLAPVFSKNAFAMKIVLNGYASLPTCPAVVTCFKRACIIFRGTYRQRRGGYVVLCVCLLAMRLFFALSYCCDATTRRYLHCTCVVVLRIIAITHHALAIWLTVLPRQWPRRELKHRQQP